MLMMLPFEAPTIFEGIHKSYFRMPRVVKDQRSKFENDDLFRQLSHESAVKYTGFKDRPLEERQMKFIHNCQEGHTEVSVVQSGNQFTLMFNPNANPAYENEGCDFDKEHGKVHIKSGFILNGVCVLWRGWIDLNRLEGFGCLEFDVSRAYLEDAMLKQQIDKQQACNTTNPANHSPLGRLNHHHPLGGPHMAPISAAPNQMPPIGLNPQCFGAGGPISNGQLPHPGLQQQQQVPVSLADSAAHYGNAAIAAAAAAAFHQALGVGVPPPPQSLHALGAPQAAVTAAAVAAAAAASSGPQQPPPQLPLVPASQHLNYTNGLTNGTSHPSQMIPNLATSQATRLSPPTAQHHTTNGNNRSPERDGLTHRLSMKRSHEPDQTQLDDVDVVSDIHAHDLDFPPRRIFKSSPITTGSHHHHHRQARRA